MKRAFLIHGWEGYPEEAWRPWLKKKLEGEGFEVYVPSMPDADNPKMGPWLECLREIVGTPDENCYFVGHSLGCITILRYLETLKEGEKVGGAVLVAGFTSTLGYEELESFFTTPIGWEKIRAACPKFTAIHSDDDPDVSLHYGDFFKEELGAEVVVEHNKGHFAGDDNVTELPSAFSAVLGMLK